MEALVRKSIREELDLLRADPRTFPGIADNLGIRYRYISDNSLPNIMLEFGVSPTLAYYLDPDPKTIPDRVAKHTRNAYSRLEKALFPPHTVKNDLDIHIYYDGVCWSTVLNRTDLIATSPLLSSAIAPILRLGGRRK